MANKGWIKLDRAITEHWIFSDAEKFRAWVDLLLLANHEDNKFMSSKGLTILKRGQLVTSIDKLSVRWGWSRNRTYRFLSLLESEQMLQRESNTNGTTLTIVNYSKFQNVRNTNGTTNGTTNETADGTTNGTLTRMNKNDKENKEREIASQYDSDDDYVSEEEWQRRLAEQDDDW